MADLTIAIAGNPNCGKTTLFNALTGTHQHVGNWPGVTVEKKVGDFRHKDIHVDLVDLPGVYSLSVAGGATSLDERLARDYLVSEKPDLVINVLDASNLERNLYLTVQLLEIGGPMVVALNMMDVAKGRHIEIDTARLSEHLGCPVVPLVAACGNGVEALVDVAVQAAQEGKTPSGDVEFGPELEKAIAHLLPAIASSIENADPRWLAIKHLEGDELCPAMTDPALQVPVAQARADLEEAVEMDADTAIACGRYDFVTRIAADSMRKTTELTRTMSDRLDRIVLSRAAGIPLFLLVIYLMFMFTINIGGAFIDFFDILAGTLLVEAPAALFAAIGLPDWLNTLLSTGIGGGIQTVATFIPIVGFLFLFLSVLEDSGYMARAAFVMDRFMRMIGLPGKSFVPLIVGFGCNVPAIMATRTLENQRDRTLTIMMTPFMSCGARLPVYALFAAAFFPTGGQNLVFALYLIGLGAAVGTGLLLKKTLLQGETAPFVMELPPYHLPTLRGLLLRTWERLKTFIIDAGRVIVAMVLVLTFLNSWGMDGSFGNEDSDNSVLSEIGRSLTPVFGPMGLEEDNWPATVGIFTGILAKEAVVGTLNTLYAGLSEEAPEEEPFSLGAGVAEAFGTIGPNLRNAFGMATDPLGLDVGSIDNPELAAEEQQVAVGTFGTMVNLFDGKIGAFAYLLMVLLYMPCAATIGAIWRETNLGWTVFAGLWTLALGYGSAVFFYQLASYGAHPVASMLWIGGIVLAFAGFFLLLRWIGKRDQDNSVPVTIAE
ncbi:Fe(2+) transporter permease subunit FeoB [Aliiruegeria sabulilitoris]|uniref:Fe(2+) transporter permease subunit FeoB n=1 Tax=Aliiruegeria sabulilitoris TaxID=1510458 RepID=UPI000833F43A|nr:Fe(2+) transporter permease subunit FeoB [Aliiruegeria sabulilitoris]NDR56264.1 Fe(2+) transporter permease subunit FeoB [Pseudoruegeria sp. M32A2M]